MLLLAENSYSAFRTQLGSCSWTALCLRPRPLEALALSPTPALLPTLLCPAHQPVDSGARHAEEHTVSTQSLLGLEVQCSCSSGRRGGLGIGAPPSPGTRGFSLPSVSKPV